MTFRVNSESPLLEARVEDDPRRPESAFSTFDIVASATTTMILCADNNHAGVAGCEHIQASMRRGDDPMPWDFPGGLDAIQTATNEIPHSWNVIAPVCKGLNVNFDLETNGRLVYVHWIPEPGTDLPTLGCMTFRESRMVLRSLWLSYYRANDDRFECRCGLHVPAAYRKWRAQREATLKVPNAEKEAQRRRELIVDFHDRVVAGKCLWCHEAEESVPGNPRRPF